MSKQRNPPQDDQLAPAETSRTMTILELVNGLPEMEGMPASSYSSGRIDVSKVLYKLKKEFGATNDVDLLILPLEKISPQLNPEKAQQFMLSYLLAIYCSMEETDRNWDQIGDMVKNNVDHVFSEADMRETWKTVVDNTISDVKRKTGQVV